MKAWRAYEVMEYCCILLREILLAAGTCSWYTNHLQLVELCCSVTDVIDSIQANMRWYAKYRFVWNGYYPLKKYSIRILCEKRG